MTYYIPIRKDIYPTYAESYPKAFDHEPFMRLMNRLGIIIAEDFHFPYEGIPGATAKRIVVVIHSKKSIDIEAAGIYEARYEPIPPSNDSRHMERVFTRFDLLGSNHAVGELEKLVAEGLLKELHKPNPPKRYQRERHRKGSRHK